MVVLPEQQHHHHHHWLLLLDPASPPPAPRCSTRDLRPPGPAAQTPCARRPTAGTRAPHPPSSPAGPRTTRRAVQHPLLPSLIHHCRRRAATPRPAPSPRTLPRGTACAPRWCGPASAPSATRGTLPCGTPWSSGPRRGERWRPASAGAAAAPMGTTCGSAAAHRPRVWWTCAAATARLWKRWTRHPCRRPSADPTRHARTRPHGVAAETETKTTATTTLAAGREATT